MGIKLDPETRQEVHDIIRATVAETELQTVKKVSELKMEIAKMPMMIADAIGSCRKEQISRRRWGVRTWLTVLALVTALGSMLIAAKPFFTALTH